MQHQYYSHQVPLLVLVSDATQDLMEALAAAAFNENANVEVEARKAIDALEGGAMTDTGEAFRHQPLDLVIYGWDHSKTYRNAFMPILKDLADLASQPILDRALDLTAEISSVRQASVVAKELQARGAGRASDEALSILGWRLEREPSAKNDEDVAKLLPRLSERGWMPSDSYTCRKFLGQAIESKAFKTINALVELHEKQDTPLPTRTGEAGYSPICDIYQKQSRLKAKQQKLLERYNDMIERLLHSGLVGCEKGVLLDWRKDAEPWVLEAEAEGLAGRLARNTPNATQPSKVQRRM